jgi:hypothetical protein
MEESTNNVCRCCLTMGTTFKNMLCEPMESDCAKLFDFFLTYSGINICEQYKITTQICSLCETKLNNAFTFRKLILESNKSLNELWLDQILGATIKEGND